MFQSHIHVPKPELNVPKSEPISADQGLFQSHNHVPKPEFISVARTYVPYYGHNYVRKP